jgi:branched-chain amino acid aminotransferase
MIFLNNKLVSKDRARISVFDHGFLYGDGIYETLRVYKGVIFMLDEHIERLFNSASLIGLTIPLSPGEIIRAAYKTLKANRIQDAYARITVSRGTGQPGLDPDLCPKPTFLIFANKFKKYPKEYYERGINVAIVTTRRNYAKALDPGIKSLNFLNNILAKMEAKKYGAYEALMLNYRGVLTEGTVSNIFFFGNGTLYTPSMRTGILGGITRGIILDLARDMNVKTREGSFRNEDIYRADEVFLTNTTMEIMPVACIDSKKIRNSPGKLSKRLHAVYRKRIDEYIKKNSRRQISAL